MSTTGQIIEQASLAGASWFTAWLLSDPTVYTMAGVVSGALAASILMTGPWWVRLSCLVVSLLVGMSFTQTAIDAFAPNSPAHSYMPMGFCLAFAGWGFLRAFQGGLPALASAAVDGFKGAIQRMFGAPK